MNICVRRLEVKGSCTVSVTMLAKDLFAWNAVDVLGSDGLFRRGLVVDKIGDEMLVDFGITDKEPELCPYEKLFSTAGGHLSGSLYNRDILFLHQLSADQAWTWYPAKALAGHSGHTFVLLDCIRGDLHIHDVFPCCRVRFPPEHRPYEAFWAEWIAKSSVPIPAELDGKLASKIFLDLWKRIPDTLSVGVVEGQFSYIYDSIEHNEQSILNLPIIMMNMAAKMESIKWKEDRTVDKKPSEVKIDKQQVNQDGLINETAASHRRRRRRKQRLDYAVPEDYSLSDMPYDVLLEVFNCMYCHERVGMRSVCHAWNDIIQSPDCTRIVQVDLRTVGNVGVQFGTCLFRCLSSVAKVVVLVGDPFDSNCIVGPVVVDLVQQLVTVARAELNAFMLVSVSSLGCCFSNDYYKADFSLSKHYQSLCPRLVLSDVRMQCVLSENFSWLPTGLPNPEVFPDNDVYLDCYTFRTAEPLDMRDIYDENCPELSSIQLDRLAVFVRDADTFVQEKVPEFWAQQAITEILRKWQHGPGDARFGPECTWESVISAHLDKVENLRALRNCTAVVLVNFVGGCIPVVG